jgi:hypothetical protein
MAQYKIVRACLPLVWTRAIIGVVSEKHQQYVYLDLEKGLATGIPLFFQKN